MKTVRQPTLLTSTGRHHRASAPTQPLVLHTGSIATALEPGSSGVDELDRQAQTTATITFDPNIRSAFFENAEQALSRVEAVVARSDVVKASDEDMRWLDPDSSPEELAARWLTLGPGDRRRHFRSGWLIRDLRRR